MGLGWQELMIIFFVVVILFGAKRIPEIARGLGKGIREFKDATSGMTKDDPEPPARLDPPRPPAGAYDAPHREAQPVEPPREERR